MMERLLGLPDLASEHGARLDYATVLVHWLMLVLFVVWIAVFFFLVVRFREGRNPKASYEGLNSHLPTYGEVAVGIVEVILLAGFSMILFDSSTSKQIIDFRS